MASKSFCVEVQISEKPALKLYMDNFMKTCSLA